MHTSLDKSVKISSYPENLDYKKASKSYSVEKKIFSKRFLNIIFNTKCIHTFKAQHSNN